MITTEELYLIIDDERHRVDLSSPSGITLSYESNLFNSLDKVSCNRSYTITLPKTSNNTRIFEFAQDIRSNRKLPKMGCEYIVDGVPMFKDGNAYLSGVKGGFQIVLTWDVVKSFQNISEDNFNINQFDVKEKTETGMVMLKTYEEFGKNYQEAFNNLESVYRPLYICGYDNVFTGAVNGKRNPAKKLYPLPVVPVPYLLKRIEDHYDVKLNIYTQQISDGTSLNHSALTDEVIDFGVIPCVSTKVKYEQNEKAVIRLENLIDAENDSMTPDKLKDEDMHAFFFDKALYDGVYHNRQNWGSDGFSTEFFRLKGNITKNENIAYYGFETRQSKSFLVRGFIRAFYYRNDLTDDNGEVIEPTLEFYMNFYRGYNGDKNKDDDRDDSPISLTSVKGVKNDDESYIDGLYHIDCYDFVFNPNEGGDYADMGDKLNELVYPVFSKKPYKISREMCYMELVPQWIEGDNAHKQDIISNLPEVSVMDFLKGIFYMVGGFPKTNKKGEVEIGYYNDIKNAVQYAVDWSERIIDGTDEEISYKIGDFKAKNWYLMANDDLDKKPSPFDDPNEQKDTYESGLGLIAASIIGSNGKEQKTVIKLPWNGAFIKDGKNPRAETGRTLKYWSKKFGETEIEADEAKPMYGVLKFQPLPFLVGNRFEEYHQPSGIMMECWNGFKDISENEGYRWLSQILENPKVLKTNVMLTPFDLKNLDMMTPVYIEKYNSYFCIIKIERSANGDCAAELLKIPSSTL